MSERLFEHPETATLPVSEITETLVQDCSKQLQMQLGSYAMAIKIGEVDGLIGSDIFPDESDVQSLEEDV